MKNYNDNDYFLRIIEETNEYKIKLEKLDEETSEELISNGTRDHELALIYQFLKTAKQSINIVSSRLFFYNDLSITEVLNIALNKGVKIKILLDDYENSNIDKNNLFLQTCKKYKNCEIKTYDKPLKAHIVTRDNKAFRYCDNPGSNIAVASFNRPNVVKNVEKVFGTFFNQQPKYTTA
jgi:HKD family nuclease